MLCFLNDRGPRAFAAPVLEVAKELVLARGPTEALVRALSPILKQAIHASDWTSRGGQTAAVLVHLLASAQAKGAAAGAAGEAPGGGHTERLVEAAAAATGPGAAAAALGRIAAALSDDRIMAMLMGEVQGKAALDPPSGDAGAGPGRGAATASEGGAGGPPGAGDKLLPRPASSPGPGRGRAGPACAEGEGGSAPHRDQN